MEAFLQNMQGSSQQPTQGQPQPTQQQQQRQPTNTFNERLDTRDYRAMESASLTSESRKQHMTETRLAVKALKAKKRQYRHAAKRSVAELGQLHEQHKVLAANYNIVRQRDAESARRVHILEGQNAVFAATARNGMIF